MKKANGPKTQLEKMMLEEDFTFCECNFAVKPTRRQE